MTQLLPLPDHLAFERALAWPRSVWTTTPVFDEPYYISPRLQEAHIRLGAMSTSTVHKDQQLTNLEDLLETTDGLAPLV